MKVKKRETSNKEVKKITKEWQNLIFKFLKKIN